MLKSKLHKSLAAVLTAMIAISAVTTSASASLIENPFGNGTVPGTVAVQPDTDTPSEVKTLAEAKAKIKGLEKEIEELRNRNTNDIEDVGSHVSGTLNGTVYVHKPQTLRAIFPVDMHAKPSVDGIVFKTLPAGSVINFSGSFVDDAEKREWLVFIASDETLAYVPSTAFVPLSQSTLPAKAAAKAVFRTSTEVNMRAGASLSSVVYGKLDKDTKIQINSTVLDNNRNLWLRFTTSDGYNAYVLAALCVATG